MQEIFFWDLQKKDNDQYRSWSNSLFRKFFLVIPSQNKIPEPNDA